MKNILKDIIPFILFVSPFLFISCQKEYSCEDCNPVQKPPVANAGRDTTISLPNNTVILNGSASSDPDGSIVGFLWTKISGPVDFKLQTPNAAQSTANSLKKGVYQFELKVTNAEGLSDMDTVKITVNESVQPNRPPIADAGPDQTVMLLNTGMLDGSNSSDPDHNITSYLWTKISGPAPFAIIDAHIALARIANLVDGTYEFELKVTDAEGLFDRDTLKIEVNPQYYENVCFYFPDPTGTIPYFEESFTNPAPNLIAVTINNLSDTLSGIWGSNYSPRCPIQTDYYIDLGENCITFNLPPGTYNWKAQSNICDLSRYPGTTVPFIQYFLALHSTKGTITVNPGDKCIIQKIVFP